MTIAPETPVVRFVSYGPIPDDTDWDSLPTETYDHAIRAIQYDLVDGEPELRSADVNYGIRVCATGEVICF